MEPLKPTRIITRIKNDDDPRDPSFLDHESVRIIEPNDPIPEPSDELYVLKIYEIGNIINMHPYLQNMLQKRIDSDKKNRFR